MQIREDRSLHNIATVSSSIIFRLQAHVSIIIEAIDQRNKVTPLITQQTADVSQELLLYKKNIPIIGCRKRWANL